MSRRARPINTMPATTPATMGMMSGPAGHSGTETDEIHFMNFSVNVLVVLNILSSTSLQIFSCMLELLHVWKDVSKHRAYTRSHQHFEPERDFIGHMKGNQCETLC